MEIRSAESESEIAACYPVLKQLRPHLTAEKFLSQVQRQMQAYGYTLIYALDRGEIKAAAGFRISEFLGWGKTLYIDDLITHEGDRGQGYGGALMDWLFERAKECGCEQIHLDSGVHRHQAHRLYLHKRMEISCHHFAKKV